MHFAWLIILQFLYINASLGWKRERIVGGTSRIIEDFPFLASLRSNGHHTCAATIVNEQYLLTAAHCCRDINLHSVIVGATFRNDDGIDFDIDKVFIHEDYIDIYNGDDIAYIKIQGKFEYSDKIQPINLPLPDLKLNPTMMLEIVGWGKNEQKIKNFSVHRRAHLNQLQSAFLGYIYRGDCQKVYEDHDITITKKMICAGIPGKNVDTCQGDSGGPLVHEGMLIGIISWGFGCADPNFYGVYTNVRYYLDWINSHTKL